MSSVIPIDGISGTARNVLVAVDLDHTYTGDLVIRLRAPDGKNTLLVDREGESGDNFRQTVFDDRSSSAISRALPPFRGRFRPAQPLRDLDGATASGDWTLEVIDAAFQDGGSLNAWALAFITEQTPTSDFDIGVRFLGGLSVSQKRIFEDAAARWSQIIVGDLPSMQTDIGLVDDVVIDARGATIDGAGGRNGNVLGRAAPTLLRNGSNLPSRGFMEFDTFDLARMESDGSLLNVIIHEMGHVLGHGTVWEAMGLLVGAGTHNPEFFGRNAMREFGELLGTNIPTPVSVANTGGPGTADGHWRERVFGNELLTGRINPGLNPISRMSIASFEDMGYTVNMDAAEPYELPSARALAMMGVDGEGTTCCSCYCHHTHA